MDKDHYSEHMPPMKSEHTQAKSKLASGTAVEVIPPGVMTAGFMAVFPVTYILSGRGIHMFSSIC